MPQVPILRSQVAPQAAPNIERRPLQSTVGESLGAGFANAGNVLFQVQMEERRKADRAAFMEASVALSDAETSILYDPQKGAFTRRGKDAFDLPAQVLPEFDKQAGKIAQGLKTERQRTAFQEESGARRAQISRELNKHEYGERERYYDETDEALISSSVTAAARAADDPERIAEELKKQEAVLNGMARRKGWDAAQIAEKRIAIESETHKAVIGRFLVGNRYDEAGRYLAANATRMPDSAVEAMQRRVILEEEQQYQRQDRERRRVSDVVTKEGDRLYATAALTPAWIESNRATLSPEDYRYFYRKLRGEDGSGPSDPIAYADLRDRAGRGEDVRTEARELLQRGQIGASDYDRILGEVEGERPGWYKRGKEFISTSAAVSDLNPDPAAAQRKAAMVNDWDEWAQLHPKATDAEARQAAERLVQEFAIVDTSRFTLTKRAPQFLVGGRTAPDLDATAVATVKALEEGRIDRTEFERQASLIKEWEDAMKLAPKPKAKPNGR
jgi:hypothetical protein